MSQPDRYALDKETIKLNIYRLLCIFYADSIISYNSDPANPSLEKKLGDELYTREISHLLLNIAITIRTLDNLHADIESYRSVRDRINNKHRSGEFLNNTQNLSRDENKNLIRTACNKIIHAEKMIPKKIKSTNAHRIDQDELLSSCQFNLINFKPTDWSHLSGIITLEGNHKNEKWVHDLDVAKFSAALIELIQEIN
ncbi:hypothetical protein KIF53_02005 [Chromobacterium subtsugae]|uniref:HEPN AbiU2-like domain-containing protein n=1 Tax=Chromobacterium subtsugae TaxID=251747 RepID=A0ABS7F8P2_9NEIS|nr:MULTISPECIES: hypothetical protein [Chromobacterium]MBW7565060.1 hypothetical protein [Chromobacterium subtsugae]MBW8286412.1 hypothetical protein [Chromobacterium subtsugae]WSE91544.1 hypothetical protein U6115_22190 [Chromobacterium subtsugae]WVH59919.1 hypothetical protein U6151_22220 [Chromobacterium subtsugae]